MYYDSSYEGDICRYLYDAPINASDRIIYFDMDGTIADLYSVEGWLSYLKNYQNLPYLHAGEVVDINRICNFIDHARQAGWKVGIISWLSMNSTPDYDAEVIAAKLTWINEHNIPWLDEIIFADYGTPKHLLTQAEEAILFDDEVNNRNAWNDSGPYRRAYAIDEMEDLIDILANSIYDVDNINFDISGTGNINAHDLVHMAEQRLRALNDYNIDIPAVDITYDSDYNEWFLSISTIEHNTGEYFSEGIVISNPDDVSEEEQKQLLSKVDRIIYDILNGKNITNSFNPNYDI